MLEGEELLLEVSVRCQALHTVFKGTLKLTTYQVMFIPLNANVYKKKNMRSDFFVIPFGLIARYAPSLIVVLRNSTINTSILY